MEFAVLLLALSIFGNKNHEIEGELIIGIIMMPFLVAAFFSGIDSIISVEDKILRIQRRFFAIKWQRTYSAEDIETVGVKKYGAGVNGNKIKMKLISGKSKSLTSVHFQVLDNQVAAIRTALRLKHSR